MFEIDSERTSLPLSPDKVLALVASLNTPMVVAADMPVEPTRAYICAFRERADEVGFSIYLHCVESNKGAFYRYDDARIPQARFDEVMGEAMAFAESLGFMMDDLGFRGLDAARRDELMRETPMFLEPSARAAAMPATEPSEPANAVVVDELADAGVVGATPISPIPDPPAPPAAPPALPAAPSPSPARPSQDALHSSSAQPSQDAPHGSAPPLQTVFVSPPGRAPAAHVPSALPNAPSPSPVRGQVGGPPSSSPARELPDAPPGPPVVDSGAREIELSIDAPEPEPEPASALPAAPLPSPARAEASAPHSSSPARAEASARPGPAARAAAPTPGMVAAAQALVRLLASL